MTYGDVIRKLRTEASAEDDQDTVALCDRVLEQRVSGEGMRKLALMSLAIRFPDNAHLDAAALQVDGEGGWLVGQVMQKPVPEAGASG